MGLHVLYISDKEGSCPGWHEKLTKTGRIHLSSPTFLGLDILMYSTGGRHHVASAMQNSKRGYNINKYNVSARREVGRRLQSVRRSSLHV